MSIKEDYDKWSKTYDTNENKTRDLDSFASQQILKKQNYNRVLEIGCGTGKNTSWLSDICEELVATDFSSGMLDIAKSKITASHVQFQKADLTKTWELPENHFDLITCNLVLEHIEKLDPIFLEAKNKLIEGGLFFICEYHPFRQYQSKQARFEIDGQVHQVEAFTHHISEFISSAKKHELKLSQLDEWFDSNDNSLPRLVSLMFRK